MSDICFLHHSDFLYLSGANLPSHSVQDTEKNTYMHVHLYLQVSQSDAISCTALGRLGRLPSSRSLLGLIQPMFPPRNSGCLTGNRPNSPKATISQPLPTPQVSHLPPKNGSWDLSFCFSQTNHLYHSTFLTLPLPSIPSCLALALKQLNNVIRLESRDYWPNSIYLYNCRLSCWSKRFL